MDNRRLIIFVIFSTSLLLLWDSYQRHFNPPAPVVAATTNTVPSATSGANGGSANNTPLPASSSSLTSGEVIRIQTDVVDASFNTQGADLRRLVLRQHRATGSQADPLVLLSDGGSEHRQVVQSGLTGNLPNHNSLFVFKPGPLALEPGQKYLDVRFVADTPEVSLERVYRFERGSYVVTLTQRVHNHSQQSLSPKAYFQVQRDNSTPPGDNYFVSSFNGVGVFDQEQKFRKFTFDDLANNKFNESGSKKDGWIGFIQHYFLTVFLPQDKQDRQYYVNNLGGDQQRQYFAAGFTQTMAPIAAGQSGEVSARLYAGPQEQNQLAQLAPGLELSIDYGWLMVIAAPMFKFLSWLYTMIGNWGGVIIVFTVLIKLIFFPLSAASYKSMAKMRLVMPKMQKIKETYGEDKMRMQQEVMALYKSEKINPIGGCLPVLVQVPFFISLYWVLMASVELRHAPFMLWIQDLSAPDPYYILPILMAITMVIQGFLNPPPPDPLQAKMMKVMPVVFSVFFFFFPAGLVLYWLINNLLSIAQQGYITHKYGK